MALGHQAWRGRAEPDYRLIDAMAEQANLCEQASEKEYWSGVPRRMLAALEIRLACLKEVAATLADEFYPPDAFGDGGMRARLEELESRTGGLFEVIHGQALPCTTGECGAIYDVWARENTVAAVRAVVEAMIERLKDQSPLHAP